MGVRLYPNTSVVASLETLAGVPAGTAARLEETEKRHEAEKAAARARGESTYDLEYRQWCEKNDDPALGDYDAFLTFGWGKFDDPHGVAPDCSGRLTDPVKCALVLRPNGIGGDGPALADFIKLAEGVHWC